MDREMTMRLLQRCGYLVRQNEALLMGDDWDSSESREMRLKNLDEYELLMDFLEHENQSEEAKNKAQVVRANIARSRENERERRRA
jgi:hypothetical protein